MPAPDPGRTTALLRRLQDGDRGAADELFPLLYGELRSLARSAMRDQRADHTLQPTALVNEAWLKLEKSDAVGTESRGHFLGVAARAMRSVLVDHARARGASKRGGDRRVEITIDRVLEGVESRALDLVALDQALERLERMDPQLARIVELRFFGGLTIPEAAASLGVSTPTVERGWRTARAWLQGEIEGR